jgi:hypothetical protein
LPPESIQLLTFLLLQHPPASATIAYAFRGPTLRLIRVKVNPYNHGFRFDSVDIAFGGVIVFRDGKILGGDAYLFYTGSYTWKGNTFKGEVLVQRHTSSPDANPLFGGPSPVGIGVSGTFTDTAAVMDGTALVGKASQIFKATLRKLAEID